MTIPLKLETVLEGRVVEQYRVEYKKGWNPADTIHSVCAYANDFHNMNGGYIVIGIEENYGKPVLPPAGIDENRLDRIQQEIFQYCNMIEPRYLPRTEVIKFQGEWVIYLRCPGGDAGPYKAPKDILSNKREDKHKEYWIKIMSSTTVAKGNDLNELFEKFASVPWDDRINRRASVENISRLYVEDFLQRSNSALYGLRNTMPLEDILVAMETANITDTGIDVRNIGLLMFCEDPHKFIPEAKIELVHFHSPEAEGSDDFTEITYTGPIQKQIRDALDYVKALVIIEKVVKHFDRAEADRFFTYPYAAIEEALVNAVFHKSYTIDASVEIRIYLDKIMILNYPGPAPWIDMDKLKIGAVVSRRYRNRRIGEFLKEIDLSEKKSTGITKILGALERNGSPPPEFETDEGRNYLIVTFRIHEGFKANEISKQRQIIVDTNVPNVLREAYDVFNVPSVPNRAPNVPNRVPNDAADAANAINTEVGRSIVRNIKENPTITYDELATAIGMTRKTVQRYIRQLKQEGVLRRIGRTRGEWEITLRDL
jgi:ATP-dependent DNA helicase RecG